MQNPIDLKKQELKSLINQKYIKQDEKEDKTLDSKIANLTHEIENLEKEHKEIKQTEKSTSLSDVSATSKNFSESKTLESIQQEAKKLISELSSKGLLTLEKTTTDLTDYSIKGPENTKKIIDFVEKTTINSKNYSIKDPENTKKITDIFAEVHKKLAERGIDVVTKEIKNDKSQVFGFCIGFPAEYKGTRDVLEITDKEIDEILKIKSEYLESGKKMNLTFASEIIGTRDLVRGFVGKMMKYEMIKEISSKCNSNELQQ